MDQAVQAKKEAVDSLASGSQVASASPAAAGQTTSPVQGLLNKLQKAKEASAPVADPAKEKAAVEKAPESKKVEARRKLEIDDKEGSLPLEKAAKALNDSPASVEHTVDVADSSVKLYGDFEVEEPAGPNRMPLLLGTL